MASRWIRDSPVDPQPAGEDQIEWLDEKKLNRGNKGKSSTGLLQQMKAKWKNDDSVEDNEKRLANMEKVVLEIEVGRLKQENIELRESLKQVTRDNSGYEARIKEINVQREQLEVNYQVEREEKDILNSQVNHLQQQFESLLTKDEKAKAHSSDDNIQCNALIARLQGRIKQLNEDLTSQRENSKTQSSQIIVFRQKAEDLEKQVASMDSLLIETKGERDDFRWKLILSAEVYEPDIADEHCKTVQVDPQDADAVHFKRRNAQLTCDKIRLEQDLASKVKDVRALKLELEKMELLTKEKQDLQDQVEALQLQIHGLKEENSELQLTQKDGKIVELEPRLSSQLSNESLERDRLEYGATLGGEQGQATEPEYNQQKCIDDLSREVRRLTPYVEIVKSLKRKLKDAEELNERARGIDEQLTQQVLVVSERDAEILKLKKSIGVLEKKKSAFSTESHLYQTEETEREKLLQELDGHQQAAFDLNGKVMQLSQQNSTLEEKIRSLIRVKDDNERVKEDNEHLQQKCVSQMATLQNMDQELRRVKERAGELSSTLEQQNIEARQLQQQKQILEGEVEARKLEVKASQREIIEKEIIHAQVRMELEHSQAEKRRIEERLFDKDHQIKELETKLEAANSEVKTRFTQIHSLQSDNSWNFQRKEVEIKEEIGRGASGLVSKGQFRGQTVAVKQIHRNILTQKHVMDEFKREVRIMAGIQHPNLVRFVGAVFDRSVEDFTDTPLLLLELLHTNLRQGYERSNISPGVSVSIFRDVAYGLHYLHEHQEPIIHRDVSAPNVLLEALPGGMWRAKLSDFGSANFLKRSLTLGTGAIVYTAPEMFPREDPSAPVPRATTKCDVFSYGIVLVEVITKTMPSLENRHELFAQVQRKWQMMYDMISQCTQLHPQNRPTMLAVLNTLNKIPVARPH